MVKVHPLLNDSTAMYLLYVYCVPFSSSSYLTVIIIIMPLKRFEYLPPLLQRKYSFFHVINLLHVVQYVLGYLYNLQQGYLTVYELIFN